MHGIVQIHHRTAYSQHKAEPASLGKVLPVDMLSAAS